MRFEVERKDLIGTPDIVFPVDKIAIFLDGCFWHGCKLHRGKPKNLNLWESNWEKTQSRDRLVTENLQQEGWVVLRFWEHDSVSEIGSEIQSVRTLRNRNQNCSP